MLMSRVILVVVGLNTVITVGSVMLGCLYLAPAVTASSASKSEAEAPRKVTDYGFYPIEKIVLNLPEQSRERYFVLDLALQADHKVPVSTFKLIEPLVRSSVITSLSRLKFSELRLLAVADVQSRIEAQLKQDFASKGMEVPFTSVLVSKLLAQ